MPDQAERLRQLVGGTAAHAGDAHVPAGGRGAQRELDARAASRRSAHFMLFTSGKGGVGTSNLVLNLAILLGQMEQRVLVVDGDIGLANLDVLGGLAPRRDLGDVLARPMRACGGGGGGARRDSRGSRSARSPHEHERFERRRSSAGSRGEGDWSRLRLRADRRGLGDGPGCGTFGGGDR